jgi:hypothetical protein
MPAHARTNKNEFVLEFHTLRDQFTDALAWIGDALVINTRDAASDAFRQFRHRGNFRAPRT